MSQIDTQTSPYDIPATQAADTSARATQDASRASKRYRTGVFWDLENQPIDPKYLARLRNNVIHIMKEDGYIDVFRAYANVTTVNVLFRQEAFALGIELVDSPRAGGLKKEALDHHLIGAMVHWAMNHPDPTRLVLITHDGDFNNTLGRLQNYGIHIVVVDGHRLAPRDRSLSWKELLEAETPHSARAQSLGSATLPAVTLQSAEETTKETTKSAPVPESKAAVQPSEAVQSNESAIAVKAQSDVAVKATPTAPIPVISKKASKASNPPQVPPAVKKTSAKDEGMSSKAEFRFQHVAKSDVVPQIRRSLPWTASSRKEVESVVKSHVLAFLTNNDSASLSDLLAHLETERIQQGKKPSRWKVAPALEDLVKSGILLSAPPRGDRSEAIAKATSTSGHMTSIGRPRHFPHLPRHYSDLSHPHGMKDSSLQTTFTTIQGELFPPFSLRKSLWPPGTTVSSVSEEQLYSLVCLNPISAVFPKPKRPLKLPCLAQYYPSAIRDHEMVAGTRLSTPLQFILFVCQSIMSKGTTDAFICSDVENIVKLLVPNMALKSSYRDVSSMLDALVREQIVYKAVWPGKEPKKKSQSQQVLLINPSYRSAHLPALFWNYEAQTSFWGLKKQPDKVSTPAVAQATSNKTLAEVDRLELNPNEKPPASSARKQDGSVLPSASTSQTTIQPHLHPTGTEGVLANEQTGSNISDVPALAARVRLAVHAGLPQTFPSDQTFSDAVIPLLIQRLRESRDNSIRLSDILRCIQRMKQYGGRDTAPEWSRVPGKVLDAIQAGLLLASSPRSDNDVTFNPPAIVLGRFPHLASSFALRQELLRLRNPHMWLIIKSADPLIRLNASYTFCNPAPKLVAIPHLSTYFPRNRYGSLSTLEQVVVWIFQLCAKFGWQLLNSGQLGRVVNEVLPKLHTYAGYGSYSVLLEALCARQMLQSEPAPDFWLLFGLTSASRDAYLPGLFSTYAMQLQATEAREFTTTLVKRSMGLSFVRPKAVEVEFNTAIERSRDSSGRTSINTLFEGLSSLAESHVDSNSDGTFDGIEDQSKDLRGILKRCLRTALPHIINLPYDDYVVPHMLSLMAADPTGCLHRISVEDLVRMLERRRKTSKLRHVESLWKIQDRVDESLLSGLLVPERANAQYVRLNRTFSILPAPIRRFALPHLPQHYNGIRRSEIVRGRRLSIAEQLVLFTFQLSSALDVHSLDARFLYRVLEDSVPLLHYRAQQWSFRGMIADLCDRQFLASRHLSGPDLLWATADAETAFLPGLFCTYEEQKKKLADARNGEASKADEQKENV